METERPDCPRCGASHTAQILYGFPTTLEFSRSRIEPAEYEAFREFLREVRDRVDPRALRGWLGRGFPCKASARGAAASGDQGA